MSNVGIYGACYKVSIIMTIFVQTFRYAAEPFFFSHAKQKNATSLYAQVMKYFIIFCLFIFLVTMLYIDIIQYFVGKDYRVGLNIVPILLLANLFLGVFFNLSIWYKLSGQTKYGAYLTVFGAIVTIIFNYLLIPILGYTGSAWATLICYFSITVASYFISQKHYPINYDIKSILAYFGLTFILYFTSLQMNYTANWIKWTVNSLLLVLFMTIVYIFERKKISALNVTV
jgi:O-antigen/teichoic acid export membrane protein